MTGGQSMSVTANATSTPVAGHENTSIESASIQTSKPTNALIPLMSVFNNPLNETATSSDNNHLVADSGAHGSSSSNQHPDPGNYSEELSNQMLDHGDLEEDAFSEGEFLIKFNLKMLPLKKKSNFN